MDDDSSVKLADFGFATRVHAPESLDKQCGTPYFVGKNTGRNDDTDIFTFFNKNFLHTSYSTRNSFEETV